MRRGALIGAGVALLFTLLVASDALAVPRRVGLFLGFDQGQPGEETLKYAAKDAQKLEEVFVSLGGIAPADAVLVTEPAPGAVMAGIDALGSLLAGQPAGEAECVVYYSGHSGLDGLHVGGSVLPFTAFVDAVEALPCGLHLIIVDACNAGGLIGLKGITVSEKQRVDVYDEPGEIIVASSSMTEHAQEQDALGGSVFTSFLVSGLLGEADADADGQVTFGEGFAFARLATMKATFATGAGLQHPGYKYSLTTHGDLVLTDLGASQGTLSLSLDAPGSYHLLEEDKGLVFGPVTMELTPKELTIPSGTYLLRRLTPEGVVEVTALPVATGTVTLAALTFDPVAPGGDPLKGLQQSVSTRWGLSLLGEARLGFGLPGSGPLPATLGGATLSLALPGLAGGTFVPSIALGYRYGSEDGELFGEPLTDEAHGHALTLSLEARLPLVTWLEASAALSLGGVLYQTTTTTPHLTVDDTLGALEGGLTLALRWPLTPTVTLVLPSLAALATGYPDGDTITAQGTILLQGGVAIGL